jgi:DNA-directed RNA polymerase specialized sigma24 family protein
VAQDRGPTLHEKVADAIWRHRAGSREAMTDLVRLVLPRLHALARGCGLSRHSAEDVVQATLSALVRHVDSIKSPEAGLMWLIVTARREALGVVRAERGVDLVADVQMEQPGQPGPEAITVEKLRRDLVWRHVGNLSVRGQAILHEVAHRRPDYPSISERTGMPIGSIGPTRRRCLAKVKRSPESSGLGRIRLTRSCAD